MAVDNILKKTAAINRVCSVLLCVLFNSRNILQTAINGTDIIPNIIIAYWRIFVKGLWYLFFKIPTCKRLVNMV